jgi:myo-inositol-1(or 4)-monophosphatase
MSLTPDQITEYRRFAEQLADAAAAAIMPYFRAPLPVQHKGGALYDPVTEADKAAERVMRELIRTTYPDHGIIGEEEGNVKGSSGLTWVLDPIDGTRAFITGMPLWGTLIALNDGQRPVIGVMNQPWTKERFVGTPQGAWCNGQRLATRSCDSIASARLMCTSPQIFENERQLATFNAIANDVQLLRYGGDCYAYCMLAAGHVDAVIEAGLQTYDVQALIPVIQAAGGVMTAWDGGDAQHGGPVVAAGDPRLHALLVERLMRSGAP